MHLHGEVQNFPRSCFFVFSLDVRLKSPKQNIMLKFAASENEKILETE